VTAEFIAYGPASPLPAAPTDIAVFRVTFAPGSGFPPDPSNNPEGSFIIVESGQLTVRSEDVEITISRATQGEPTLETVALGTDAVLEAGDSFWAPPSTAGELRNDGQEPAVALFVSISPSQGGTGGTPVATPAS
jgi:quercetin dioxygenase-like cupin family protein